MPATDSRLLTCCSIFLIFLRLGLTSFGGPVAHLGYFRHEFVMRRQWLNEHDYADLVALCQFLPGPASSQVGMALGLLRGGHAGALAAWLGFTLPSALLLTLLAMGIADSDRLPAGILHNLQIVALAVVAQAVYAMARQHCQGWPTLALMAAACALTLWLPAAGWQMGLLVAAGLCGLLIKSAAPACSQTPLPIKVGRRSGAGWLVVFAGLLVGLPLLHTLFPSPALALIDAFYRVGALVFGGGHVVLPLLHTAVVNPGWVSNEAFLAGYGAAQAVPGPLFTFAAFLGAAQQTALPAWSGAVLAVLAIFAPSFLLVAGSLPFWSQWRDNRQVRAALTGINAAVVGLLLAALLLPLQHGALSGPTDLALGLGALLALARLHLPPWLVVLTCAAAGWLTG